MRENKKKPRAAKPCTATLDQHINAIHCAIVTGFQDPRIELALILFKDGQMNLYTTKRETKVEIVLSMLLRYWESGLTPLERITTALSTEQVRGLSSMVIEEMTRAASDHNLEGWSVIHYKQTGDKYQIGAYASNLDRTNIVQELTSYLTRLEMGMTNGPDQTPRINEL